MTGSADKLKTGQRTTVFGIRHHGPGSARSLVRSLQSLSPDIVLVEGPPEATESLSLLAEADMRPPVALLLYSPEHLQQAVYYPFAVFSPEWQACQYAINNNIPVRFIDLPQSHQMAERVAQAATSQQFEAAAVGETTTELLSASEQMLRDPLSYLAHAAGYPDSERWWEHLVEHRQDDTALFEAILEAMSELRQDVQVRANSQDSSSSTEILSPKQRREAQREAYMRQCIRKAKRENFQRIAVVCGAWHSPALSEPLPAQKADSALLKGLPKLKVKATWIPWTYDRLSTQGGYGAGITSPGWYHHLWQASQSQRDASQTAMSWLTKVARLLRKEDLDTSAASVIEAVRLAETLAAMRDAAMPSLRELNEATQTVLCFGEETPLKLIHRQLIVGDRIGQVSANTPLMPLQADLQQLQKRLRLKPEASDKLLTLDLRKPTDLARSHLLHRLRLLAIDWGIPQPSTGKGTFKEAWKLSWTPELSLAVIEAGRWGNTVVDAAVAKVRHGAEAATQLDGLTHLLDRVLLADLSAAIVPLMQRLQAVAALSSRVVQLMDALPPLVNILRYRDVRQTDGDLVRQVIDGLVPRLCIGLPMACASLDDEAAEKMLGAIARTHSAINLLRQPEHTQAWRDVLQQLCDQGQRHSLIAGYSCRLLFDDGRLPPEETARRLGLALSLATQPTQAAAWVEGFLRGSGLLLLHDATIWKVLDEWVCDLSDEAFTVLLPLLRRTFSRFSASERRQMGEGVRLGREMSQRAAAQSDHSFDTARANASLQVAAQFLGLSASEAG
ncbi:MAG: DUF5682 family protein [Cyanobacteria bacterium J06623_4]